MLTHKIGNKENETIKAIREFGEDWGVCVLDEVHELPAKTF
jgi:hypothetical protein